MQSDLEKFCAEHVKKYGNLRIKVIGCKRFVEKYRENRQKSEKTRLQYTVNTTVNISKPLNGRKLEKNVNFCPEKQLCLF